MKTLFQRFLLISCGPFRYRRRRQRQKSFSASGRVQGSHPGPFGGSHRLFALSCQAACLIERDRFLGQHPVLWLSQAKVFRGSLLQSL